MVAAAANIKVTPAQPQKVRIAWVLISGLLNCGRKAATVAAITTHAKRKRPKLT